MSLDRIVHIELDQRTLNSRSPEVEHERAVAVYDLLEENHFVPVGKFHGPYRIRLAIEDSNRLIFDIRNQADETQGQITLPLTPFRRIIRRDQTHDAVANRNHRHGAARPAR